MVHKIKKLFASKKKHSTNQDKNNSDQKKYIAFAPEKEMDDEIRKQYPKKLFGFTTPEGVKYVMRGTKKFSYEKEIALGIIGGKDGGYSNVVVEKNDMLILIHQVPNSPFVFEIETTSISDIDSSIEQFGENYFQGYGFKVIDNLKELEKIYMHSNADKYKIAAIVLMVVVGTGMYIEHSEQQKSIIQKPLPPHLPPVSAVEQNEIRHSISLDMFKRLLSQIKNISKSKRPEGNMQNTRISNITLDPYEIIQPQTPFYDESSNTWRYSDENTKRGGLKLRYRITTEKTYPENGYTHKSDLKNKHIYTKETSGTIEKFFNPNIDTSRGKKIPVSTSCLQKALKLGKVKKRDSGLLEISIKKGNRTNYMTIASIEKLMASCPVYVNGISIDGNGQVNGKLFYYYKF